MGIFSRLSEFLLDDFGLNPQIRELVSQPLSIYSQRFSFLLPGLDFLLEQDRSLDGNAVF